MPGEMIDFGKFAQTAIAFQNLQETIRRNDIGAQGLVLEQGRLAAQQQQNRLEAQRLQQQDGVAILNQIDKLEESPFFASDKARAAKLLAFRGQVIRDKLGVKDVPIPEDAADALGGYEAYRKLYQSVSSNNPAEREEALVELAVANPKQFKVLLDDYGKSAELPLKMQNIKLTLEMNQEKLDALKLKKTSAELQDGLYGLNLAELREPLQTTRDPKIEAHFRKMQGMSQEARDAYARLYPDVAQQLTDVQFLQSGNAFNGVLKLERELAVRKQALQLAQEQAPTGQARPELAEEVQAYQSALQARKAQYDWLQNRESFFDPEKYKQVLTEEQNLRIAQGKPRAALASVADERMKFAALMRDDKLAAAELKKNEALGLQRGQEVYLTQLQAGDDDVTAAVKAAQVVRKEFPGVPVDLTKFENPNKKGKLDVGIKLGQEDQSRNFKAIEAAQNVLDYVTDLREKIQANPAIVGRGAQLSTAFAGAGQQLRAIVGADPSASKFLNTKPRDEAEALYEILVYMQAKTMDPTGALDTKVVAHAREVVGDINTFTTGPQQVLNKLDTAERSANRSMRRARQRLKGGAQGYLADDTPNKPVSEMSEAELLKIIGGGANP
jgi:hypothetical protein